MVGGDWETGPKGGLRGVAGRKKTDKCPKRIFGEVHHEEEATCEGRFS